MEKNLMQTTGAASSEVSLWTVDRWCRALGYNPRWFYGLTGEQAPRSLKLGGTRRVVESPAAYVQRMESLQANQAAA